MVCRYACFPISRPKDWKAAVKLVFDLWSNLSVFESDPYTLIYHDTRYSFMKCWCYIKDPHTHCPTLSVVVTTFKISNNVWCGALKQVDKTRRGQRAVASPPPRGRSPPAAAPRAPRSEPQSLSNLPPVPCATTDPLTANSRVTQRLAFSMCTVCFEQRTLWILIKFMQIV